MKRNRHALWISWYPHRRTTGLCDAWNVPLCVISCSYSGPRKWLEQSFETFRLLRHYRPKIFFVQNPSLGLTVLAVIVRPLFGYLLVVDAHNEGVRPFVRTGAFVRWLTQRLLKAADFTIVTNEALAEDVHLAGGVPLILPDRLPTLPADMLATRAACKDPPDVLVISTFAPDEPIDAIMIAAATMPDIQVAITGNPGKKTERRPCPPGNVKLTGFVPDIDYWGLLADARLVCDLTLMPDCLVCGAYEGLAMARPMVLSDNPATRALFGSAAVLTESDPGAIAKAIRDGLARQGELENSARIARENFKARWSIQAAEVWNIICGCAGPGELAK